MRELSIAYGNSRSAKQWSNKTIRFGELKERLKVTIRTSESAEEYARFPKSKKDTAKDHGGFVAGVLKGGRRKIDTVESRSMVALDGDRIDPEFLTGYEKAVPYASVLYSTHSHTAEEPRVRLVFPLARDVSPEEYVAVARYLAQGLGMDYFDECSYQPNQLMYWPSTPSNGEFVYKEVGGAWLDPDDVLSAHPEWRDPTRLPTSSRESRANSISIQKVQDPLEKEGVVGLFNRVFFPINLAMDAFLQDVYEPTDKEDRYHLIESSSMAGVEIKEGGKFAYSHHAKDPAYLKLCNAFDLVRIHKFGEFDDKASFKAMCDFALTIDSVKVEALEERRRQAGEEFADGEDWRKSLELDRKGGIKDTLDNIVLIIQNDEELKGIAFNCHRDGIDAREGLPWEQIKGGWSDSDAAALKVYLSRNYGIYSPTKTKDAVVAVAAERAYHPMLDTEPGRVYYARLQEGVTFERVVRLAATFDLAFFCPDPFGYAAEDEVFTITEAGNHTVRRRLGNLYSNPVYRLKGVLASGAGRHISISTNGAELKIANATLSEGETLVIDTAKMTAWVEDAEGNTLRNALPYIGELNFPTLGAGLNTVEVAASNAAFTELEIQAKSRWR